MKLPIRFKSPLRTLATAILATVALMLPTPKAAAQFRNDPISITNTVPANTTNSSPGSAIIDASRVSQFSLQFALKLVGAGTTAIPFTVQRSVDGANWVTGFSISVTPSGTNTASALTNVITGAIPYWKVSAVQNDNASAITNLVVTPGIKRNVD